MMSLRGTFDSIHSDYRRYRATGERGLLQVVLFSQGFWASSVFRVAHWVTCEVKSPFLRIPLRLVTTPLQKLVEIVTGISLSARCRIGRGLYIGHFGPTIVHPEARIGDNCNLSQGVTLGFMPRGKRQGTPTLGNRVFVGPNAVIIGNITVGDDAAIGAGSVVTRSVPPMAVVAGNPAQVISSQGSFEFVQYDGMDDDLERSAALELRQKVEGDIG